MLYRLVDVHSRSIVPVTRWRQVRLAERLSRGFGPAAHRVGCIRWRMVSENVMLVEPPFDVGRRNICKTKSGPIVTNNVFNS